MDRIIIEKVETCDLVKTGWERDGYGAFGEPESTSYRYVIINGKEKNVYSGYIIHDGETVLDTTYQLQDNICVHMDDKFHRKEMARKYKNYMDAKEEISHLNDDEILAIKRDINIKKILG